VLRSVGKEGNLLIRPNSGEGIKRGGEDRGIQLGVNGRCCRMASVGYDGNNPRSGDSRVYGSLRKSEPCAFGRTWREDRDIGIKAKPIGRSGKLLGCGKKQESV